MRSMSKLAPGQTASATNVVANSGFETNTTGWGNSGTAATLSRITTDSFQGAACLKIAATGADARAFYRYTPGVDLLQVPYTGSFWVKANNAGATGKTFTARLTTRLDNLFMDTTMVLTTSWQRMSVTMTPAVSQASLDLFAGLIGTGTSGDEVLIDNAQMELGLAATPYIATDGAAATRALSRWVV